MGTQARGAAGVAVALLQAQQLRAFAVQAAADVAGDLLGGAVAPGFLLGLGLGVAQAGGGGFGQLLLAGAVEQAGTGQNEGCADGEDEVFGGDHADLLTGTRLPKSSVTASNRVSNG